MPGPVPFGGKSANSQSGSQNSNTTDNSSFNQSGSSTTNPLLSDFWKNSFSNASGNVNGGGLTGQQQQGFDFLSGALKNNPNQGAYNAADSYLAQGQNNLGFLGGQIAPLTTAAPRQLSGNDPTSASPTTISAPSGLSQATQYNDPFQQQVVDASVKDYNTNVDRNLNAMRASRDASGAFGDRAAVADSQYLGDASRGLGTLVSGLRSQGFNTAQQLGQSDAGRLLSANTANAANQMGNNQFNSSLLNNRQQFNVGSGYQGDQQKLQANNQVADYSNQAVAMQGQRLNNVVGNNTQQQNIAQILAGTGGVGQDQLMNLIQAAMAGNGQQSDTSNQGTGTSQSATNQNSASKGKSATAGMA